MGVDFDHRWSQAREHVLAMKELWTKDAAEFHGRYIDFPAVRCNPKPVQKPHPPVMLGGNAKNVFKRVVQWGDGWFPVGLTPEDVGQYIRAAAHIEPPQSLVDAVYRPTEGNPLFMIEVVRLLARQGQLAKERSASSSEWDFSIPREVRAVIRKRLELLTRRCYQVLATASVIGREFSLEQLAPLMTVPSTEELMEIIEEALPARVIDEIPGPDYRFRFSHALIQDTLSSELSTSRRARLHADIGEVLERLYRTDIEAHADEIAYHFTEAAPLIGAKKLVQYSFIAGERALATYAHEEALVHFHRALAAKAVSATGLEPAEDAETASLLSGLGHAQLATQAGRRETSETASCFIRAFDYYADVGDLDRAVAIAYYPLYPIAGQRGWQTEMISRALDLVPPESHHAGRLLSRCGRIFGIAEGDYHRSSDAFGKGLAIARREGDEGLEMQILAEAGNVDYYHSRRSEGLEKSLQVIELSSRNKEPHAQLLAHFDAVFGAIWHGDLTLASRQAAETLTLAEKVRERFWLARAYRVGEYRAHVHDRLR